MARTRMQSMTEGKALPLLLRFAFPVIIGNLFNQVYSMVDSMVVGRAVSADALASVGATNAPSLFFMSIAMGMTMGTGVLIAQYYGAKDEKNVVATIINSLYVNVGVNILTVIVGLLLTRPLLLLLGTPDSLMGDAVLYMQIYMGGLLPVAIYYTIFAMLRALGDAKTPLYFLVFSSALNVALDILFVVTFRMGVAGAAIATVIAQGIAAVICAAYAVFTVPYFRMALKDRRPRKEFLLKNLKLGIPMGFQYSLTSLSGSILQWVVNGFGENVIAAFTMTARLEQMIQQVPYGLATALATFSGQNIGAGKTERVREGLKASFLLVAAYSAVLFFLCLFWSDRIMRLFVRETEVIRIASAGLRISSILFFALGMIQLLRNLLNAVGDAGYAMVNGMIEIVSRVGFVFLLTAVPFIGVWGIWWANGLAWAVTALFAWRHYRRGNWKKKKQIKEETG